MNVWEKGEDWLSKDYYYLDFWRIGYVWSILLWNRYKINI